MNFRISFFYIIFKKRIIFLVLICLILIFNIIGSALFFKERMDIFQEFLQQNQILHISFNATDYNMMKEIEKDFGKLKEEHLIRKYEKIWKYEGYIKSLYDENYQEKLVYLRGITSEENYFLDLEILEGRMINTEELINGEHKVLISKNISELYGLQTGSIISYNINIDEREQLEQPLLLNNLEVIGIFDSTYSKELFENSLVLSNNVMEKNLENLELKEPICSNEYIAYFDSKENRKLFELLFLSTSILACEMKDINEFEIDTVKLLEYFNKISVFFINFILVLTFILLIVFLRLILKYSEYEIRMYHFLGNTRKTTTTFVNFFLGMCFMLSSFISLYSSSYLSNKLSIIIITNSFKNYLLESNYKMNEQIMLQMNLANNQILGNRIIAEYFIYISIMLVVSIFFIKKDIFNLFNHISKGGE